MTFTVVTTFHKKGYETYGKRMIETFLKNWPSTVVLIVYAENCIVTESAPNLIVRDLNQVEELVAFKSKWKDDPKARGWCTDSTQKFPDKTQKIGFKWDAIRFSHKVYSIFDCARTSESDWLLWMDADTICHSPITINTLEKFCPDSSEMGFLGREKKYTECGLYSLNLKSNTIQDFLKEFQRMYDEADNGIFLLDEWHDSYVFDNVRLKFKNLKQLNWSAGIIKGEGHPLINSDWGAYLDHLKGDRKDSGRSNLKDLKIKRTEAYWQ